MSAAIAERKEVHWWRSSRAEVLAWARQRDWPAGVLLRPATRIMGGTEQMWTRFAKGAGAQDMSDALVAIRALTHQREDHAHAEQDPADRLPGRDAA